MPGPVPGDGTGRYLVMKKAAAAIRADGGVSPQPTGAGPPTETSTHVLAHTTTRHAPWSAQRAP